MRPRRARERSAIPRPRGFRSHVAPDISITPMIDVMMALLIIFMVVTPVLTSYGAILPRAVHPVPEPHDDAVRLGISRAGTLFIGTDSVGSSEFGHRLRDLYAQRPGDHLAYLWADRGVDFALVLDVIEAARQAGVRTIGAIVDPILPTDAADAGR
jgi:biopolymer transport protein ExbD